MSPSPASSPQTLTFLSFLHPSSLLLYGDLTTSSSVFSRTSTSTSILVLLSKRKSSSTQRTYLVVTCEMARFLPANQPCRQHGFGSAIVTWGWDFLNSHQPGCLPPWGKLESVEIHSSDKADTCCVRGVPRRKSKRAERAGTVTSWIQRLRQSGGSLFGPEASGNIDWSPFHLSSFLSPARWYGEHLLSVVSFPFLSLGEDGREKGRRVSRQGEGESLA